MANPERGEVDLVCGEKTYTLFLSTNALCEMQKRTGKTFGQILAGIMSLDIVAMREYLRAVLATHHGKELGKQATQRKVDVDFVIGDIIDDATMVRTKKALVELFTLNTPNDEEKPKEGDSANPPDAQDGTGGSSTSTAEDLA